jgi:hypothetical protein
MARSRRLRRWTVFCAFSESFQKSGAEIRASSFSSSARFAGASKKPPELFDLRFDGFVFGL